jgi:hypothetical protein
MKHVTEEDLVLYHYGEAGGAVELESHLAACDACQLEYSGLRRILAAVDEATVPEPPDGFERVVWARLQPRLEGARPFWQGLGIRQLAFAAGLAVFVLAAVIAVRYWPVAPQPAGVVAGEDFRERVLLLSLGEHLDRTEMVLSELANTSAEGSIDISQEQAWAEDLVQENRLYRHTAANAGDSTVLTALDELERILLEVARGPSTMTADELDDFRQRLDSEGTVFKVRVLGSRVREREERVALAAGPPRV